MVAALAWHWHGRRARPRNGGKAVVGMEQGRSSADAAALLASGSQEHKPSRSHRGSLELGLLIQPYLVEFRDIHLQQLIGHGAFARARQAQRVCEWERGVGDMRSGGCVVVAAAAAARGHGLHRRAGG